MEMEEKTVIEPKQKRSILTKQKIKGAARKLFSEKGYYTVTSNNIAAAAKVPIGSFYNYFGNKKGVIMELIQDFNDAFHQETLEQDRSEIQQISSKEEVPQFLISLLNRIVLSPVLADPFYRIIHALQFTEPDVLQLSEEVRSAEIGSLVLFLQKINEFHPVEDIPVTAKLMHSTIENIILYIHHLGTKHEQNVLIQKTAKMFYGLLFHAE